MIRREPDTPAPAMRASALLAEITPSFDYAFTAIAPRYAMMAADAADATLPPCYFICLIARCRHGAAYYATCIV